MIKAIIFDMDGLLIDSEPFWQKAEMVTFSDVGITLTKEMCKETMGLRVDEVVAHWFSRHPWQSPSKKEVENGIVGRVIDFVVKDGEAKEGAKEVMDFLFNKHLPMAIASSSQSRIIETVLDKLSIRKYIQFAYSAENEIYGKPHPGVYITAAKKLKVDPEFCLAFEDSPNGVIAAKAARMKCIAVPDQSLRDNRIFFIADAILNSLKEFSQQKIIQL